MIHVFPIVAMILVVIFVLTIIVVGYVTAFDSGMSEGCLISLDEMRVSLHGVYSH